MKKYNNAADLYDIFYKERIEDVHFYNGLISEYKYSLDNNNIVEIGAGTGRVLLPIAKNNANFNFTAIDLNAEELKILKLKVMKQGISNIKMVNSKVEDFKTDEKFSFAIAPFRVFQHCQSVNELDKVIKNINKLLTGKGRFAFDLFNPWIHLLTRYGEIFNTDYIDQEGNIINRKTIINKRDYFKQTQKLEETYTINYINGDIDKLDMTTTTRNFFKDEASLIVEKNGFNIVNIYGSFKKELFGVAEYPGELIFDCIKTTDIVY